MSKIYAQQKKPHEAVGTDSVQQTAPAFSNQAMLDLLKAPENVRAQAARVAAVLKTAQI